MRKVLFLFTPIALWACDGATAPVEPKLEVFLRDHTWWFVPYPNDPVLVGYLEFHALVTPPDTIWWEFEGYINGELDTAETGTVFPGTTMPKVCESPLPSCRLSYPITDSTHYGDYRNEYYLRFSATAPGTGPIIVEWLGRPFSGQSIEVAPPPSSHRLLSEPKPTGSEWTP